MDIITPFYPHVSAQAFSPSGNHLALWTWKDEKRALEIWDLHQHTFRVLTVTHEPSFWQEFESFDEEAPPAQLGWSWDETMVAVTRYNGAIDVWSVGDGQHLFSTCLHEPCRLLAWGKRHTNLVVSGATTLLYWNSAFPTKPFKRPIHEHCVSDSMHPTAVTFSPDDSEVVFGGDDGELEFWGVEALSLTTKSYSLQAPDRLRIAHLWYSPDETQLVVDHFYHRDDMIGPAERASSILFRKTGTWIELMYIDATIIGWSVDGRRLLGTCDTFDGEGMSVVQFDAWTGKEVARTSINAEEIHLQTICLMKRGAQVLWCTQPYEDGWQDTRLVIDTILL
jgi:hypothetical protein